MAAEFTRFSETILTKQAQRVVSITVKPMISDCTGRIYFTDLMVQEGDRLTGYVINTETILQKYREGLFFLGETVEVRSVKGNYFAVAEDIDEDGNLIVRREDGSRAALNSGEISPKLQR